MLTVYFITTIIIYSLFIVTVKCFHHKTLFSQALCYIHILKGCQ